MEGVGILPLRNAVLFPGATMKVNVGRPRSVRLVETLHGRDAPPVGVVCQREAETVEPTFEDVHATGTLARLSRVIRLGSASYSVELTGIERFRIVDPMALEPYMTAAVERLPDTLVNQPRVLQLAEELRGKAKVLFDRIANPSHDTKVALERETRPGALADLVLNGLPDEALTLALRQEVLDLVRIEPRLRAVLTLLDRQLEVRRVREEISNMVKEEIEPVATRSGAAPAAARHPERAGGVGRR